MCATKAPRRFGYARVSTVGQTLEAQLEQLAKAGCAEIFREKVSGAKSDRRELNRLLRTLMDGDEVVVTRIDRLARSILDLFGIVKAIHDAGGRFRSLAEPWAATDTAQGRMMLAVMGGMAEVERELIRTRTAEGRARAKAAGRTVGGPKPKLSLVQRAEALARLEAGEVQADIARSYNVDRATIARLRPKARS